MIPLNFHKKIIIGLFFIIIFNQLLIAQSDDFTKNFYNLHTSLGLGFFVTKSPYSYEGKRVIGLPSTYFSSTFLLKKLLLAELNINYQFYPLNLSASDFETSYPENHLRSSIFIGYGFFNNSTDSYFIPEKLISSTSTYSGGYITTWKTYRGYRLPYTKRSGLVLGIGVMYIKSEYEPDWLRYSYLKKIQKKHTCPFLEFKYLGHSLDTKRPIYTDLYLRILDVDKNIGWDIGFEYHNFSHIFGSFFWHGQQLGVRFYKGLWSQKKNLFEIYWRFFWSFRI